MLITNHIPTAEAQGVSTDSTFVLTFDSNVDPSSLQPGYLRLYNDNRQVSIPITWQVTDSIVEIIPERLLEEGYQYTLIVMASDNPTDPNAAGIKNTLGEGLEETLVLTFYTGYNVPAVDTTNLPYDNLDPTGDVPDSIDDSNLIPPDGGGISPICAAMDHYGEDFIVETSLGDECLYNQIIFPEYIEIRFDRPIDTDRSVLTDILSVTVNDIPFSMDQLANARLNNEYREHSYDGEIINENTIRIPFDFDPYDGELPPLTEDDIPPGRLPVWPNTEYILRLKTNKIYLDGVPYSSNWESTILGILDPMYTSVSNIRSRLGYSIEGIDDCDIARMIHNCSLGLIDLLQQMIPTNLMNLAAQYVECCVLRQLLQRKLEGLGDDNLKYRHQFGLEIGYNDPTDGRKLEPYDQCLDDVLREITSRKHGRIKIGVKSSLTRWYPSRRRGIYDRVSGFYRPNLP